MTAFARAQRVHTVEQRERARRSSSKALSRSHFPADAVVRTKYSDLWERVGRTKLPDMAAVTAPTKVIRGRNLRVRRKQLGMSQELAAAELEMRRHHLSPYENGKIEAGD